MKSCFGEDRKKVLRTLLWATFVPGGVRTLLWKLPHEVPKMTSSVLRVSAEPRKPWAFIFKISGIQGSGNTMWSLPNVGYLPGNPPGRPGVPRAPHKVWVGQERNLPIGWRWNWSISAFILALGRRNFLRAPRIRNHKSLSMWLHDPNSHFLCGPKTPSRRRLVVPQGTGRSKSK